MDLYTPDANNSFQAANANADGDENNDNTVNVVYQAPVVEGATGAWKTGLFDCMDDEDNAIGTLCCPCWTFGEIAEIIDQGETPCVIGAFFYVLAAYFGIPWIISCNYRRRLRRHFGLVESPAPDLIVHFFCEFCALCQEYRELKLRGLDPEHGWQRNAMNQQMATMAPPNQPTMSR